MLIDQGADVNQAGPGGGSPLVLAMGHNDKEEIIRLLIIAGANLNQPEGTSTPLQYALTWPNMEKVAAMMLLYQPSIPNNINQESKRFKEAKKMADEMMATVFHELFLSFLSGTHRRLGQNSKIDMLCEDVLEIIVKQLINRDHPNTAVREAATKKILNRNHAM